MKFAVLLLVGLNVNAYAQDTHIVTAGGGITVTGANPNYDTGFGNVNGLGLGTPPTGTTLYTSGVSGGVLYVSPVTFQISGAIAKSDVKAREADLVRMEDAIFVRIPENTP